MSLKEIFTTPIYEKEWDRDPSIIDKLKEIIHSKELNFPYTTNEEVLEFSKWIIENAKDFAYQTGRTQGYIGLKDMWHRTMKNGSSYVPPHTHPTVWCVGTFYFEDDQGDLVLIDPRGTHDWEFKTVQDNEGHNHSNCTDYYYKPKKNTCIMFPSYLKHLVLPTQEGRLRTAISWNILYDTETKLIEFLNPPKHLYTEL